MRSQTSTREKIVSLVGQVPAKRSAEVCFHCGGPTVLGRMTTMIADRKVVSCFRAECSNALAEEVSNAAPC